MKHPKASYWTSNFLLLDAVALHINETIQYTYFIVQWKCRHKHVRLSVTFFCNFSRPNQIPYWSWACKQNRNSKAPSSDLHLQSRRCRCLWRSKAHVGFYLRGRFANSRWLAVLNSGVLHEATVAGLFKLKLLGESNRQHHIRRRVTRAELWAASMSVGRCRFTLMLAVRNKQHAVRGYMPVAANKQLTGLANVWAYLFLKYLKASTERLHFALYM